MGVPAVLDVAVEAAVVVLVVAVAVVVAAVVAVVAAVFVVVAEVTWVWVVAVVAVAGLPHDTIKVESNVMLMKTSQIAFLLTFLLLFYLKS